MARGLLRGARERMAAGQFDAAAGLAERARDLFHEHEAIGPSCEAARVAAATRMRRGDLGGARALYEWVAEEGAAGELAHEIALARTELGGIAEAIGDLRQALDEHQASSLAAERSERQDLIAIARGNLGRLRQRSGELDQARLDLEASRDGFLAAGVLGGAINATICLGDLCRQEGRLDDARQAFEQALAQADGAGSTRLASLAALNLGHVARDLGDRDRAARAFERAADLAEETGEALVIGGARLGLGLILADAGPIEPALQQFEAAESVFLASGNAQATIAATVNAASLSCRLGELQSGRERMVKALEVLGAIGDGRGEAEIGLALAEVAVAMGDLSSAQDYLERFAEAGRFATRLERRRTMLEARLDLRALLPESAAATLAGAEDPAASGSELFAYRMARIEVDLLLGERGVLEEAMVLADEADAGVAPREAAAAATLAGHCAAWLGVFDVAEARLGAAIRLWERTGERMGLAGALDALARVHILLGRQPETDRLVVLEAALRAGGAVDAADGIALTLALVDHLRAERADESPEDLGAMATPLAQRSRRGHRIGVWSDLHLIARVLDDLEAVEEADALAADGRPAAPAWRLRTERG